MRNVYPPPKVRVTPDGVEYVDLRKEGPRVIQGIYRDIEMMSRLFKEIKAMKRKNPS